MATWRPIGTLTPVTDSWLFFDGQAGGNFFKMVCSGVPPGSGAFLKMQAWRNQAPEPEKILSPQREQVFTMGSPGLRLISIRRGHPLRSEPGPDFQVALFEWEESPRTDPEVNLWVPGKV